MANFACAINAVERKRAGLDGRNTDTAIDTRHFFRVEPFFPVDDGDKHDALCQLDRLFD